eukprot:CAMPEP_0119330962 /NCGR_PEP_ID=MMETSP1333-20130426/79408_1 /TAXON_ID=418940 /ORGANISM="Scyphosphaera apsteinii, Strain RCC1455" /LENGTH=135 /DNA_ID=CAMNT_0007340445 /DNA_START=102 /DNA_END=509 /DNA_ORIENTATION=+
MLLAACSVLTSAGNTVGTAPNYGSAMVEVTPQLTPEENAQALQLAANNDKKGLDEMASFVEAQLKRGEAEHLENLKRLDAELESHKETVRRMAVVSQEKLDATRDNSELKFKFIQAALAVKAANKIAPAVEPKGL